MLDETTRAALERLKRNHPDTVSVLIKGYRADHGGGLLDAIRALAAVPTYAELEAENERLRAALAPFAAIADQVGGAYADNAPAWGFNDASITYGDLRRAAAALSTEEPRNG